MNCTLAFAAVYMTLWVKNRADRQQLTPHLRCAGP